jgi:hypothetical protein
MVYFPLLVLERKLGEWHRSAPLRACAWPADAIDYADRKQCPPGSPIVANPEALVFKLLHLCLLVLFLIGASLQVRSTLRASTVV